MVGRQGRYSFGWGCFTGRGGDGDWIRCEVEGGGGVALSANLSECACSVADVTFSCFSLVGYGV